MPKIAHRHPLEVISCIKCQKLNKILINAKKGTPLGELSHQIGISSEATLNHLYALQYFFRIEHLKLVAERPKWGSDNAYVEQLRFGRSNKIKRKKRKAVHPIYTPELVETLEGWQLTKNEESIRGLFMHIWWILNKIIDYSWWPSPKIVQQNNNNNNNNNKKIKIEKWTGKPQVSWYGDIIYFGTKINNNLVKNIKSLRKIGEDLDCAVVLISTESITQDEYVEKVTEEIENIENEENNY